MSDLQVRSLQAKVKALEEELQAAKDALMVERINNLHLTDVLTLIQAEFQRTLTAVDLLKEESNEDAVLVSHHPGGLKCP